MSCLSEIATIVAGSTFGFSPGASLRYQMVKSVPSPEMQAALDELVAAGIVIREDEASGAVKYTASREVDFTEYRKVAFDRMMDGTTYDIRVFIPKGGDA
jgi:hypothetical protein